MTDDFRDIVADLTKLKSLHKELRPRELNQDTLYSMEALRQIFNRPADDVLYDLGLDEFGTGRIHKNAVWGYEIIARIRNPIHHAIIPLELNRYFDQEFDQVPMDLFIPDGRFRAGEQLTNLYLIRCDITRMVKIGRANNPSRRFNALSCANPFPLRLVGHIPCNPAFEPIMHYALRDRRVHREWFNDCDRQISQAFEHSLTALSQEVVNGEEKHVDEVPEVSK